MRWTLLLIAVVGCSGPVSEDEDAGIVVVQDAGQREDAGAQNDAGTAGDAGTGTTEPQYAVTIRYEYVSNAPVCRVEGGSNKATCSKTVVLGEAQLLALSPSYASCAKTNSGLFVDFDCRGNCLAAAQDCTQGPLTSQSITRCVAPAHTPKVAGNYSVACGWNPP